MLNRSYSSVFIEEGGWTRYKQISWANSANLANNYSKKLGTLTGSARARTVRPSQFGAQQEPLRLRTWKASQIKCIFR
jgi:hypothetical protein